MGMNSGKELEPSLPDCTCLRVLSKAAWEQVPAVFESCLIWWEGGNHKSRKFISCISSHQKGSSAGHISVSSSESWCLGLCCMGSTLPPSSSKTQGRENIFMYRGDKDFPCTYCRDLYGNWCSFTASGWVFGSAKAAVQGLGWPCSCRSEDRLCKSALGSAQNVATAPLVSLGLDKKWSSKALNRCVLSLCFV